MFSVEYIVETNIKKRGHTEGTDLPNGRGRVAEPIWNGEQRPERQLDSDGLCLRGNHGVRHCEREAIYLCTSDLPKSGALRIETLRNLCAQLDLA